jgi:hypothetical protein
MLLEDTSVNGTQLRQDRQEFLLHQQAVAIMKNTQIYLGDKHMVSLLPVKNMSYILRKFYRIYNQSTTIVSGRKRSADNPVRIG